MQHNTFMQLLFALPRSVACQGSEICPLVPVHPPFPYAPLRVCWQNTSEIKCICMQFVFVLSLSKKYIKIVHFSFAASHCFVLICGYTQRRSPPLSHSLSLSVSLCLFCLFSLYLYRRKGYVKFVQWLTWPIYCRVYTLQIRLMSLYAWIRGLHELHMWNLFHRLLNIWCNY